MSRFIEKTNSAEELDLISIWDSVAVTQPVQAPHWNNFLTKLDGAQAYSSLRKIIPRGTRIRLKTFRHIGIKATPQLIGAPNAAGVASYAPPQALADGVDFERRGRFPCQKIVARGDNYAQQSSNQGARGFQYEDAVFEQYYSFSPQRDVTVGIQGDSSTGLTYDYGVAGGSGGSDDSGQRC